MAKPFPPRSPSLQVPSTTQNLREPVPALHFCFLPGELQLPSAGPARQRQVFAKQAGLVEAQFAHGDKGQEAEERDNDTWDNDLSLGVGGPLCEPVPIPSGTRSSLLQPVSFSWCPHSLGGSD